MDLETIRQHYLFSSLEDEQFASLQAGMSQVSLDKDQALFMRGDPADYFYFVLDGQVELSIVSAAGDKKVIEVIHPGQTFAEAVAFMKVPRFPVNAKALRATVLCQIQTSRYIALLSDSTDACLKLLADLSRRLHSYIIEIENLTIQNARHRLAAFLLSQIQDESGDSADLELDMPRHIIASRLSMQPETLSRLLGGLAKEGIISVEERLIRISSVSDLRKYS
ncbi:MAG TPA: Crp/Fnr family transcriptional regulator [Woeseiaceae bacterium]